MNKYSDWLKIDLHLHTDWSKKTKENDYQGNFSVEILHQKLIKNSVEIFSLTDHNIINIEAYEKYYQDYSGDNHPLLLVGVELDIVVTLEKERTYHSLLIFNDSSFEKAKEISEKIEAKYKAKGLLYKERKLTIDEVIELFAEDDFFFIPHAGNTKSIVDGYRGSVEDAQKMVLLMQSAFEKVPEKARQKYNEGFDKVLQESFQNKEDIAYIQFSDNHNIEQYPKTHKGGETQANHKFYYIKGSKNFETLRLAFIDPKSRIKSSEQYLLLDKIANKLEKIKIENQQGIENREIFFSPHLNVIIGGRSSGKSLLLNVLGSKIDKVTIKSHYSIDDVNFLIKSKDDADYKVKTSIHDNLIYINQGDIVRYFEQNDLKSLADKSGKTTEYQDAKNLINTHKQILKSIIDDLLEAYEALIELGGQIKYELHQSTISSIFNKEYTLNIDDSMLIEVYIDSENILNSKILIEEILKKIDELKSNKIYEFSAEEIDNVNSFLKLLNEKKELVKSKSISDIRKLSFIEKVKFLIDSKNSGLSQEAREKASSKEKLDELKQDIKEKFQKSVKFKISSDKVENFIYETEEKIIIAEDVKLVLCVEKDSELKSIILDGIKDSEQEKSLYINLLGLIYNEKSIKNFTTNSREKLEQKINTLLEDTYRKFNNPKDYLMYSDETTSKENSPGLNSENYLKIILQNDSSKMVFIDQPEDNLGNRFISDELVDIIREIKFNKQIFLVTHNPAMAVYGDAECIIIAENNDNIISYRQIVLENVEAQKDICSILDGGEYIFDNRSKKYNIQRILKETQNG